MCPELCPNFNVSSQSCGTQCTSAKGRAYANNGRLSCLAKYDWIVASLNGRLGPKNLHLDGCSSVAKRLHLLPEKGHASIDLHVESSRDSEADTKVEAFAVSCVTSRCS